MIRLHPNPETSQKCPVCDVELRSQGWYMPGMRVLADLKCLQCGREYYGDLRTGHGFYFPMLLDKETGQVFDEHHIVWFASWLRESYRQRTADVLPIGVEEFRPLRRVLLLNCLDVLYGHALLKLLNAQYYLDHCSDFDLIVVVPEFMRWLVPDGVAAIWTVKLPLRRGTEWNDWLAAEFQRKLEGFEEVWISVAYSHPHASHFDVERFTRIAPFDVSQWQAKPSHPVVTFIWRDDRRWESFDGLSLPSRIARKIGRTLPKSFAVTGQQRKVTQLAETLRRDHPQLTFAVVGPGTPAGFPAWIEDLRASKIDETVEHKWCQQYARSHVVVGVHGSNMLLPSAHAATMINLLPSDRIGNSIQDVLVTEADARMALIRYRVVPQTIHVSEVASMIGQYIEWFHLIRKNMEFENVSHMPEHFPFPEVN